MVDRVGDSNTRREQGQIVIEGNRFEYIQGYAIDVDASQLDGNLHQGPVRNLRELNTERLLPGVVITNNIMAANSDGIRIAGEPTVGGRAAAVPFARVTIIRWLD